jgi:glycosyltransferase involved in cell wall biosynthesis
MTGWLVNDYLTCIPGTKTIWHDLLENIEGLQDVTYPDFGTLPFYVERKAKLEGAPDYIIRNATYFRPIRVNTKQISLLQDIRSDAMQLEVCNSSDVVICNSNFTLNKYRDKVSSRMEIVPLGIDFELFKPQETPLEILPNSILYVGAANNHPKGFDQVLKLIKETDHNFCLIMKDDFTMQHPRVRVFNKLDHQRLVSIYNQCSLLICTSVEETQHLSGIEAGACDLPLVVTNVGTYHNRKSGSWGINIAEQNLDFKTAIDEVLNNKDKYRPREYFLNEGFSKEACMAKWNEIVRTL